MSTAIGINSEHTGVSWNSDCNLVRFEETKMASKQQPKGPRKMPEQSAKIGPQKADFDPYKSSIEQQLDMNEDGPLRGDEILHHHGIPQAHADADIRSVDEMMENYQMDMSELGREGDEMSGDDHSSGLQGGDPDLMSQPHIDSGMPGERTDDEEFYEVDLNHKSRRAV